MALLEEIAEGLARDTLAAMEELGDDRFYMQVSKVLGDASPTVQEAFNTAMRFLLVEKRGRQFLTDRLAQARAARQP